MATCKTARLLAFILSVMSTLATFAYTEIEIESVDVLTLNGGDSFILSNSWHRARAEDAEVWAIYDTNSVFFYDFKPTVPQKHSEYALTNEIRKTHKTQGEPDIDEYRYISEMSDCTGWVLMESGESDNGWFKVFSVSSSRNVYDALAESGNPTSILTSVQMQNFKISITKSSGIPANPLWLCGQVIEVKSFAELRESIADAVDGDIFKIAFIPSEFESTPVQVPADKYITIDLNGVKLPVDVEVVGQLKVIDTSTSKSGFISGTVTPVDPSKVLFDLNNTVIVTNSIEVSNLAVCSQLGAQYKLVLCNDLSDEQGTINVKDGANITIDFNGHFIDGLLRVWPGGHLTVRNNLALSETGTDLMSGYLQADPGSTVDGEFLRLIEEPEATATTSPFCESADLVKAGAAVFSMMMADFYDDFEIPEGKELSLDLNGHTLVGSVIVNGTFYVLDSSVGEVGQLEAQLILGEKGKVQTHHFVTVASFAELTMALATAEHEWRTIRLSADLTGTALEIPAGIVQTIDLNGHSVICDRITIHGSLAVLDSAGTAGYIQSAAIKLGRKGSFTVNYGPIRGTFNYLNPGMMVLLK